MAEYFVQVKVKDWEGNERTLGLEPFNQDDDGRARELGWARTCQVSPLPEKGILFKKEDGAWKEVGRVF